MQLMQMFIPLVCVCGGGVTHVRDITELFHCMWRKEAIPQEYKDAPIIHLYKRKGNPQVFENQRGISLLSIAGKILAKLLLFRLNVHFDQKGQMWIQKGQRDNRHNLHNKKASGEKPRTECRSKHDVCRPHQSF